MTQVVTDVTSERMAQLRQIVVEVLEIEPDELTATSNFVDDHEADSLLAIEILSRVERDMGVSIPQDELPEMTDMTSLYGVVARNAGWVESDA